MCMFVMLDLKQSLKGIQNIVSANLVTESGSNTIYAALSGKNSIKTHYFGIDKNSEFPLTWNGHPNRKI